MKVASYQSENDAHTLKIRPKRKRDVSSDVWWLLKCIRPGEVVEIYMRAVMLCVAIGNWLFQRYDGRYDCHIIAASAKSFARFLSLVIIIIMRAHT